MKKVLTIFALFSLAAPALSHAQVVQGLKNPGPGSHSPGGDAQAEVGAIPSNPSLSSDFQAGPVTSSEVRNTARTVPPDEQTTTVGGRADGKYDEAGLPNLAPNVITSKQKNE